MSSPRSILPRQANKQRLQFPVPGDFGYEEPVGRKKYGSRNSAIHKLIFNHQIQTPLQSHPSLIPQPNSPDPERQYEHSLGPKNTKSPITGLFLKAYEPDSGQKKKQKYYTPQKQSTFSRIEAQYPLTNSHLIDSEERSGGNPAKMHNFEGRLREVDSLDTLVSPSNFREKTLDSIIKMRLKNPTFINSQI